MVQPGAVAIGALAKHLPIRVRPTDDELFELCA
jgi:hypothetical protein